MQVLLAFPTLGYSGPLCHCGGFYSATAQIKAEREKEMKEEEFEVLFTDRAAAFPPRHHVVFQLIEQRNGETAAVHSQQPACLQHESGSFCSFCSQSW